MSERQLATIRRIKEIHPIENADNLELAIVDGWQCVVKKGELKEDDLCVYIEIDSIVPDVPYFEFMKSRKFRVKTIKLRGQLSQGLVVPCSGVIQFSTIKQGMWVEGKDVTDHLGITKYIAPSERDIPNTPKKKVNKLVKFMCRFEWYRKMFPSKARKSWPEWIQKTDEPRVQNLGRMLSVWQNIPCIITEKLDGQSATYFVKKTLFGWEFGVCSRNILLQTPDNSNYWNIAKDYNIKEALINIAERDGVNSVVLQGEIIGPKVANGSGKNIYDRDKLEFYAFNLVFDNKKRSFVAMEFDLYLYDISVVPFVHQCSINDATDYVKMADGRSQLYNTPREGIVIRDVETNGKKVSFKAISNEFLLKHKI